MISVSLNGLRHGVTYSETLYRGTCSKLLSKLVVLPTLKTSPRGTFERTDTLAPGQAAAVNNGGAVIRLVSGRRVSCGAFVSQAGSPL